jgi:hypothetical protein
VRNKNITNRHLGAIGIPQNEKEAHSNEVFYE